MSVRKVTDNELAKTKNTSGVNGPCVQLYYWGLFNVKVKQISVKVVAFTINALIKINW